MTREEAIKTIQELMIACNPDSKYYRVGQMAIQALSQEPRELLIIKSNILLHQDERKKWTERIIREKESGVIILPPYFEPLLVPADIEINTEQEPCDDAISRDELLKAIDTWDKFGYTETGCFVREPKGDYVPYIHYDDVIKSIKGMPSVTQKSGKWIEDAITYYEELNKRGLGVDEYTPYFVDDIACSVCLAMYSTIDNETQFFKYCPNCGAKMVEPQERSDKE